MSTLCVFHRADLDGHCSGAIVKRALGDVDFHGYDYVDGSDSICDIVGGYDTVYMVDCSLQPLEAMLNVESLVDRLVWIDHHKSALAEAEKLDFNPAGLRRDGDAGCELTWEYLFNKASTPRAVYLLGRYDVFDLEADDDILPFQYGMRAEETCPDKNDKLWGGLLRPHRKMYTYAADTGLVADILQQGRVIQRYQQKQDDAACAALAFETEIAGKQAIASNGSKGSLFFSKMYDPEKHDVMMPFWRSGSKQLWSVSLYSDKEEIDCSEIAGKFGGGGHAQAAGFQCEELPFKY